MDEKPNSAAGIVRGTARLISDLGFRPLSEFKLISKRRADLMGLSKSGTFLMAEVKSCAADFKSDSKWTSYLDYCDLFYFAVDEGFPTHILPPEHGLIVATPYEAEIVRPARPFKMNGTRRKAQTLRFALAAAHRLQEITDPGF